MDFKDQIIEIIRNIPKWILEGKLLAIQMLFKIIMDLIVKNWIILFVFFLVILIIAIFDFFINCSTRLLGKIFYRISYLGILLVLIIVFGIEILVNNWINLILFTIGVISFELVGFFLRKINLWKIKI